MRACTYIMYMYTNRNLEIEKKYMYMHIHVQCTVQVHMRAHGTNANDFLEIFLKDRTQFLFH